MLCLASALAFGCGETKNDFNDKVPSTSDSGSNTASTDTGQGGTQASTSTDGKSSAGGSSDTGNASSGGNATTGSGNGGTAGGGASSAATSMGSGTGGSVDGNGGTSAGGAGGGAGASSGGSGSGGDCQPACGRGFSCCDGHCVNLANDILNCGACGVECEGAFPFCNGQECATAPCSASRDCRGGNCCGSECCGVGQLCCEVNVGPTRLGCVDAVEGTCPMGCPECVCAAGDTPIATPGGERPIASLRVGDLVYSVDGDGTVVVPIVRVNRTPVAHHQVLAVRLEDGRQIRVSPGHPLADRGTFADLAPGSTLGEQRVLSVQLVPYREPYTYDILPGSASGVYYAAGALIGSTLARQR